jgi:cytochrome c oxidase subunit 2
MWLLINKLEEFFSRFIIPFCHVPNQGSYSTVPDLAAKVDDAFMLVLVISVVLLVLVTSFMIYFAIKYRASKNPKAQEVKESLLLEITWTVIPTILVFIIFYVGWVNFVSMRRTPENSMPVKVVARMWSWSFEYENGLKSDVLRVPVGRPVSLSLTSNDVIHSLFIPELKLKEDAVPGMETSMWVFSDRQGEYDIVCAEYCGLRHSYMKSKVLALSEKEFNNWYESGDKKETAPSDVISVLEEYGCLDCHSTDGSVVVGPSFKGIYGRTTTVISNEMEHALVSDDVYLTRSILYPDKDIVKGYSEGMPSFEGEISEEELKLIINYLKGIK